MEFGFRIAPMDYQAQEDRRAEKSPCLWRAIWSHGEILCVAIPILRETPGGYWIGPRESTLPVPFGLYDHPEEKHVPKGGRYASETKAAAIGRFRARTRSYLKHCRRRLEEAEKRSKACGISLESKRGVILSAHDPAL